MPLINGQQYPYTEKGKEQARQAQQAQSAEQGQPAEQGQKDMMDILAAQMQSAMYDSKDAIIETLRSGGQKESANVLARFMVMAVNSLRMQGKRVDPGVMVLAMVELAKSLGELAIQSGVMDDDPRMIEESFFAAIARADDELQSEALGEEERQQYAQIMQKMRQIQQQGGAA